MTLHNIYKTVSDIDKLVVMHHDLDFSLKGIIDCIDQSFFYKEPIGSLLLANGGLGKTTICKIIMSKYPRYERKERDCVKKILPAFYVEVPSPVTVKSLAIAMLSQMQDPFPLFGNAYQLTDRLCKLISVCETKLIILDEFHNLLDIQRTKSKINTQVCDWIRYLVNKTKISFCLVGLPRCASILHSDEQLLRRFSRHYELKPILYSLKDNSGQLNLFFKKIEEYLNKINLVKTIVDLSSSTDQIRIYLATKGNPYFIMMLVKTACIHMLKDGRIDLLRYDFVKAWDSGCTFAISLTKENPFTLSDADVLKNLRKY